MGLQIYMYDASYLFWGIWKCLTPFIEEGTMQKVLWVYASDPTQLKENFELHVRNAPSCKYAAGNTCLHTHTALSCIS